MIVFDDNENLLVILSFLHTKLVMRCLAVLCPTVDFNPGSLAKVPIDGLQENKLSVAKTAQQMISVA
jgi:hypothetical protein